MAFTSPNVLVHISNLILIDFLKLETPSPENHQHAKDGRREAIETRLANSSATSVSDLYLPENMMWKA